MGERKIRTIYSSSKDAFVKMVVLVLTIGISILASLIDFKSCYITILVQACNNMYDFYQFTDNKRYTTMVKREAIAVIFSAIIAIVVSIIALLDLYVFMRTLWMKLLVIFLVTLPLIFVYNDYKMNVKKENEFEE